MILTAPLHIKPIDKGAVHRICSGQVILDLSVAVKELVENALDAGATNIEVRLKEYGSELIEVADNGHGVAQENYESLALKHYTSKLVTFEDLEDISTFGFRGEALSSLSAVAGHLAVVTRTCDDEEVGMKLVFDKQGQLVSKTSMARSIGTTIAVRNLFEPLPVRLREFKRNLKREFSKLISLLQAYALIQTGKRILCTNQTNAGGRSTIISTQSSTQLKDNIVTLFGRKTAEAMQPLDYSSDEFRIVGYVSKATAGCARTAADRQFFYVNGRPVDLPKAGKVLNETYRTLSSAAITASRPMAVIDFQVARDAYDVNVTPDKRKIFLHEEKLMLEQFQTALLKLWEPSRNTYGVTHAVVDKKRKQNEEIASFAQFAHATQAQDEEDRVGIKNSEEEEEEEEEDMATDSPSEGDPVSLVDQPATTTQPLQQQKRKMPLESFALVGKEALLDAPEEPPIKQQKSILTFVCSQKCDKGPEIMEVDVAAIPSPSQKEHVHLSMASTLEHIAPISQELMHADPWTAAEVEHEEEIVALESIGDYALGTVIPKADSVDERLSDEELVAAGSAENERDNALCDDGAEEEEKEEEKEEEAHLPPSSPHSKDLVLCTSIDEIRSQVIARRSTKSGDRQSLMTLKFHAASIAAQCTTGEEEEAIKELERVFAKQDFARMEVLGQFNLGFIVARLGKDLFIIDQHASDERTNFERLTEETVLNRQPLLHPQKLDLSPTEELTVREHVHVFKANGFDFKEDDEGKLVLSAVPFSKNITFGADDVSELIGLLDTGHSGQSVRPSRVKAMLASRACRSSIMIGKALSKSAMKKILLNLSVLKTPWCCAHGRPTMRHLAVLDTR